MGTATPSACRQCGSCCTHLLLTVPAWWEAPIGGLEAPWLPVPLPTGLPPAWRTFARVRGVQFHPSFPSVAMVPLALGMPGVMLEPVDPVRGVRQIVVASRCPQLTKEGRCRLHGTPAKPRICRDYPTPRDRLDVTPGCGYLAARKANAQKEALHDASRE